MSVSSQIELARKLAGRFSITYMREDMKSLAHQVDEGFFTGERRNRASKDLALLARIEQLLQEEEAKLAEQAERVKIKEGA